MFDLTSGTKTLVFHDNFAQNGGAERVAEHLHRAFAGADLATTLLVNERSSAYLKRTTVQTTWMQMLPLKARLFRWYFLLYPFAIEGLNLQKYDLIVTSCFGYAKGVKKRKDALHICYCHSPMRWVWRTADYLQRENMGRLKRGLILLALKPLKAWEIRAAKRPDFYIANSRTVASRLHEAFGIDSTVIYPPIDTKRFSVSSEIDDYFITLSRLVPYKRIDLAVQACSRTGRRLKVIGDGPDSKRLRRMAGPTIEFLGRQPDEAVSHLVCHCKALIFPGEEDFGMAPLEVNAAGRPVVAFKGGGAAETIMPGLNGVFFERPTADSLIDSLELYESMPWEPNKIRSYAERFDSGSFSRQIRAFVERAVISYEGRSASSTNSAGNPDWKVFPAS